MTQAPKTPTKSPPPDTPLIYSLMSRVMADIGAVGKNQTNAFDKYKFRGIDDVYNAVQPAMVKHGVFCVPEVVEQHVNQVQTSQGKPAMQVILRVQHTFYAPDGSSVSAITLGEAMDRGDKAGNKAMSAAFKYALFETFCIPTEEDKDTENHSPEVGAQIKTPQPTYTGGASDALINLVVTRRTAAGIEVPHEDHLQFAGMVLKSLCPDHPAKQKWGYDELELAYAALAAGKFNWQTGERIPDAA